MIADWSIYPNFRAEEFSCKCGCGKNDMQPALMGRLQALRYAYGKPMLITSGYRCANHPAESIKAMPGSGTHSQGIAADIAIGSDDACIKAAALASKIAAVGGIGVYPGRGFIHVDIRPRVSKRTVTWWAQINGKYQPLPASLRAAIKAQGGQC